MPELIEDPTQTIGYKLAQLKEDRVAFLKKICDDGTSQKDKDEMFAEMLFDMRQSMIVFNHNSTRLAKSYNYLLVFQSVAVGLWAAHIAGVAFNLSDLVVNLFKAIIVH